MWAESTTKLQVATAPMTRIRRIALHFNLPNPVQARTKYSEISYGTNFQTLYHRNQMRGHTFEFCHM